MIIRLRVSTNAHLRQDSGKNSLWRTGSKPDNESEDGTALKYGFDVQHHYLFV